MKAKHAKEIRIGIRAGRAFAKGARGGVSERTLSFLASKVHNRSNPCAKAFERTLRRHQIFRINDKYVWINKPMFDVNSLYPQGYKFNPPHKPSSPYFRFNIEDWR